MSLIGHKRECSLGILLLKARAIENQCYTIGVNRIGKDGTGLDHNGGTSIYNPLGETKYYKENEEDIFTTSFEYRIS